MHSIFGKHEFSTEEDPHHSESAGTTINENNLTSIDRALIKYYQKNHQQLKKSFQIQHMDHDIEKLKQQNNGGDGEEEQIDGGYGWFIVLAAFLVQMTGIGCITSVMQDYYQQHTFGSSPSVIFQLNLVGATANSIMNLMSLLSQIILSRFGSKCGIFIACLCCSFGLELASLSTELWHLLLTQGLLFGIGCSIIFYVSMSVIPQWFNKREGIALGLASSGSCIGGLVMPFIMTPLNRQLGASWCYRILGFINLAIGIIACILFKDRKITNEATKNNKKNKNIKDIIDFSVLKNMNLIIWCIADTFIEAGYYVPYFFLPSYATHLGLSDSQGSLLVSIASVCNAFGRIIAGHIGDKIGYINTTIFSCLITSSSCFFLWTFAFDFTKLMLFAILFGTFGGIFIAQGASITRIVTGKEKFETGYAMFLLLTVIAMYGPNLSTFIETSLLHHNNINPYFSYKLFTAFCYMIGSIFLIYLKLKLSKYKLLIRL